MNANPYLLTSNEAPADLARTDRIGEVLEDLFEQHISIIAPRHYGKTVFATALSRSARQSKRFSDVVFWDLRHCTPANDTDFFAAFATVLREQVASQGSDSKAHFTPEKQSYTGIREFFEYLHDLRARILIVLDGMDHPLDCVGLTKNLWDNLAGFAKIGSVNLLTTSRKPLRQLCKNASGRSSDFWLRFDDPPVRLKAFSAGEINAFLKPLADARDGLEQGTEAEFFHWTGGFHAWRFAWRGGSTKTVGAE